MLEKLPKLSIGMPVFNGEEFLSKSIESILCQSFTDFELIILDNYSTDGTKLIALSYLESDARIRYICNDSNIGSFPNFNLLLDYAKGQYFMWAAYDDIRDPSYIMSVIGLLDKNPNLELAFSREKRIDADGDEIFIYNKLGKVFSIADCRLYRILKFIWYPYVDELASAIYGIHRLGTLTCIGGFKNYEKEYWARDLHLLLKILIKGGFSCVDSPLFHKRDIEISSKPYSWPQMSEIYPLVNWLFNISNLFFGRSLAIIYDGKPVNTVAKILLLFNRFLKTQSNWLEVYKGYSEIIKNSDLPTHQKFLLQSIILFRSSSIQFFEIPGFFIRRFKIIPFNAFKSKTK